MQTGLNAYFSTDHGTYVTSFQSIMDTGTLYCGMVGKYGTQGAWCNGMVLCLLIYKVLLISNVSRAAYLFKYIEQD